MPLFRLRAGGIELPRQFQDALVGLGEPSLQGIDARDRESVLVGEHGECPERGERRSAIRTGDDSTACIELYVSVSAFGGAVRSVVLGDASPAK